MKKEYWKLIKDYENYMVSSFGRVKNIKSNRILKLYKDKFGYLYTNLCNNGKVNTKRIHRLVAETFLPNPNNYPCINHKDEDKTNNIVSNLEWCTYKYNSNYGTRNKRIGIKQSKQVLQYDKNGNFIKEWESTMECKRNGYNQGHVAACCRGERKTHKGFIFKYKNEEDN